MLRIATLIETAAGSEDVLPFVIDHGDGSRLSREVMFRTLGAVRSRCGRLPPWQTLLGGGRPQARPLRV